MKARTTVIVVVISMGLGMAVSRLYGAYRSPSHSGSGGPRPRIEIPEPLLLEHDELQAALVKATRAGGKTGDAAREAAKLLSPHLVKEEEFALPPLGLLPDLARGKVTLGMRAVLPMTDQLKAELPQMLEEHQAIAAALQRLTAAAKEEQKPEYARLAQKLMRHAQTEEGVTYPTAILIGEYLHLKLHSERTVQR